MSKARDLADITNSLDTTEIGYLDGITSDVQTQLNGKSDTSHNHSGVYEPADATIVKDADIGVTVQAYNSNLTAINQALTSSSSPTFTTLNATTVDLGNWTVTESAGVLYFATSGVNKMKLDASGNLTVVGDVTAYGTI